MAVLPESWRWKWNYVVSLKWAGRMFKFVFGVWREEMMELILLILQILGSKNLNQHNFLMAGWKDCFWWSHRCIEKLQWHQQGWPDWLPSKRGQLSTWKKITSSVLISLGLCQQQLQVLVDPVSPSLSISHESEDILKPVRIMKWLRIYKNYKKGTKI